MQEVKEAVGLVKNRKAANLNEVTNEMIKIRDD